MKVFERMKQTNKKTQTTGFLYCVLCESYQRCHDQRLHSVQNFHIKKRSMVISSWAKRAHMLCVTTNSFSMLKKLFKDIFCFSFFLQVGRGKTDGDLYQYTRIKFCSIITATYIFFNHEYTIKTKRISTDDFERSFVTIQKI